jgi:TPR repeat protein
LYEKGEGGVPKNLRKAKMYYQEAIEYGNDAAAEALDNLE